MTATGQFQSDNVLVFPSQVLTCEDGSQPEARTGPSLRERLQTLIFTYLPNGDILTDNFGSVWSREGADPSPGPTTPPPPDWEVDNTPGIMWPQKNLEEVRVAQELADAGDPDYTWQLEPNMDSILTSEGQVETPEIIAGFVRREFGWEEFALVGGSGTDNFVYGGFHVIGAQLIRCEPGKRNPLWPDDPRFGGCAPTIDLTHYETVGIFVTQPGEQGPEGIWVASFASESDPLRQMVPMTEEGLGAFLESFLQARIAGEGAEQYLGTPDNAQHFEIPLLYATSTGAPFERAEFEVEPGGIEDLGPLGGVDIGVKVRLFAEGGQTVVEQTFELEAWRWYLGIYQHEGDQTTENGVPLPRP
jgi:hypothetical protein